MPDAHHFCISIAGLPCCKLWYMSALRKMLSYIIVTVLISGCSPARNMVYAQEPPASVSMQVFYDELSPYGQWIEDPEYGYVWMPQVDVDFRPYYTNGYWVMTDYGNTWVSSYAWGWAPFHYGRWVYSNRYGWLWIPGYEWGPAWVCWRFGGGYYGWAPLGPWFSVTLAFGDYNCPVNWWIFIPQHHLYRHRYVYSPRQSEFIGTTNIIRNTRGRQGDRTVYVTGPSVEEARASVRENVRVYNVTPATRPAESGIDRNQLKLFRPGVSYVEQERLKPAPTKIMRSMNPIDRDHPTPVDEHRNPSQNIPRGNEPVRENDRQNPVNPNRDINPESRQQPVQRPQMPAPERPKERNVSPEPRQQQPAPRPQVQPPLAPRPQMQPPARPQVQPRPQPQLAPQRPTQQAPSQSPVRR